MARHEFRPVRFHNAIGAGEPAFRVGDGDTLVTETLDAWGVDGAGVARAGRPNPMTGPIFVEGAEPGDALEVRIDRMTPNRDTGWTYTPLAANVVDPAALSAMPARQRVIWALDREAGRARLAEPPAALADWSVPLRPMLGATICFPVAIPGAGFYLGDGHFCQGDGEIVGTGIETSFEVEVTLRVRKGWPLNWPRGETARDIFVIGNARPLDQALQHATTEMLAWLAADWGLDPLAASHCLGQCVRYDVANVFNPAYSVACRLDKSVLPPRKAR